MNRKTRAVNLEGNRRSSPGAGVADGRLIPFPPPSCSHCALLRDSGHEDLETAIHAPHLRAPYAGFSHLPVALQRWRQRRGLKISAAAAGLGVAASTWGHWETGFRFPTGSILLDLVQYTGLSLVELVCEHAEHCPLARRKLDIQVSGHAGSS